MKPTKPGERYAFKVAGVLDAVAGCTKVALRPDARWKDIEPIARLAVYSAVMEFGPGAAFVARPLVIACLARGFYAMEEIARGLLPLDAVEQMIEEARDGK